MIDSQPDFVREILAIADAVTFEELKARMNEKVYKMAATIKKNNKQISESVINRDDLLAVFREINGNGLSNEAIKLMQPLVQVNPNHGHIY